MPFRSRSIAGVALLAAMACATLHAASPRTPPPPLWFGRAQHEASAASQAGARRAAASATTGDGTRDHPWAGWEQAFASIPASGGRVQFDRGHYTQNASIKLPVGLTGWLFVVGGPGVTITLTASAPRFLDPDLTADHQVVRNIWIEGFEIDAGSIGGKDHVIFGNYVAGGGVGGWQRVDWDRIVIKDVRAYDLVVDPSTASHRGGIAILSSQTANAEPIKDTITDIYIEDVRIEGGNWGILIDGNGPASADHLNVDIDGIWLVRCWHSLLARQPRFASSNFQVGEKGRVGTVHVIDCFGRYAADTGLELNATASAHVPGTTIEDAAVANFYYTNYNTPRSEPLVAFDHCVSRITGPVDAPYGIGWWIKDTRSNGPSGRFRIDHCRFSRTGTPQATGTGAGVTASGRLSELAISNSIFDLSGVELAGLTDGQRLLEPDFEDDVTLRLRNVTLKAEATRSAPGPGLNAIRTDTRAAGKTLTLDWDQIGVSIDVAGAPADYTIFTSTIHASAASLLRGRISRYHVDHVRGDDHARAINIDLAHQIIEPSLVLSDIDARRLPKDGTAVTLNNAGGTSQTRKVSMRRILDPVAP
jgi:hypothetical protein